MPVFNAASSVERAVESLLLGTFADFEMVCVDDGSTDETRAILEKLQARDARVRLLSKDHGGIVDSLNCGLEHCQAPLVARMDADDWCEPSRLQNQASFLDQNPTCDLVSCLVRIVRPDGSAPEGGMKRYEGWVNQLCQPDEISRNRFVESPIPHPTVLARRGVFEGGYASGPLPEDYELWLRCLQRGLRFGKVPRVLVTWTDGAERATRTDERYSREAFRRVKADYLARGPLFGRREVIVWGAGMNGKPWLRILAERGISVPFVVEVDRRKIGQRIHGALAIRPDDLLEKREDRLILTAVGAVGGREWIRDWLVERGLHEGRDFWALC